MDLWRAERLNAPSDFMKAPDGATVSNPTPSLMTPAQFAGSPLVPPSAPHTTPVQAPPLPAAPQTTPFRAPLPSLFVGEGLGFTESSGVEVRRPIHHKHQSEKISQQRSDHRLSEDERSSSEALREVGRLKEEKEVMRREMEHLRGRVECLREQIRDQQSQINRQCTERDELHSELKSCKTELGMRRDELSALKSEHDLERQRLEKELQDSKEETERLQSKLEEQNVTPDAVRDVTSLRAQVQEVMSERDELKNQLSALNSSLSEQSECVQKLRRYIGSSTTERREEEELKQQIQQLEKEKEALSLSVQLLNVRVNAANDILAIQEKELEEQEQSDPLYSGSKAGQMLGVWRQKVFTLLVKLQTRDLQLHTEKTQLQNMVSSLQQEVECLQSQISVLQHHLEDKTAQLELQHVHTQGLQQQLDSVLQENIHLIEMNKSTEGSLKDISETAHSVMSAVELKAGQMEAVQSSVSQLNQRLAFAAKRLDTVQGLLLRREALWKTRQAAKPPESSVSESFVKSLQSEVALLSSERDKLTQELKRTPALIQASLSELQQQQEKEVGLLKEALLRSKEELEASESRQLEIQRHCEEQEGTIAELRAEAQRLQQQCDSVLHKVSEVESVCAEKLREMETQLNTARREHTKAVVALRQVQRQAEREKEQMKEAERERTEHTHTQVTHLQRRLKDKDKDRNLLLAVVQEQGLMNQYKKLRKSAIQTVEASKPKPHHQSESRNPSTPESLLGALQALSAAVMGSSEEEDDEEGQDSTVTQTPSCADTHKELC